MVLHGAAKGAAGPRTKAEYVVRVGRTSIDIHVPFVMFISISASIMIAPAHTVSHVVERLSGRDEPVASLASSATMSLSSAHDNVIVFTPSTSKPHTSEGGVRLQVLAVGRTWLCVRRGAATGVVSCDSCPPLAAPTVRPQHGTRVRGVTVLLVLTTMNTKHAPASPALLYCTLLRTVLSRPSSALVPAVA